MFCENCGKQLPDTAAFCTGCGTKTNAAPTLEAPLQTASPVTSTITAAVGNPSVPEFQAPVPPVSRPDPIPPQYSQPVQAEPIRTAIPMQPAQPYGAAPDGVRPSMQHTSFDSGSFISYGQYLVMLLLTCIPILNIVLLFKWSFFGVVNPNKRNFAKAMLTIVIIAFLFSMIMGMATASLFG